MISISVLLATYNGEKYVAEQLASIVSQTLPPCEIVVSDDQSSDNTLAVVKAFARTSAVPIKVMVNSKNKGYAKNFLEGAQHCGGDYVAFCDQDDVWMPHKLERLAKAAMSDKKPSMVFSDTLLVDQNLQATGQTGFEFLKVRQTELDLIHSGELIQVLVRRPCVTGMTMLCKRSRLLEIIELIPQELDLPHDYLLSMGFAAGGDYAYVDEALVMYRQHAANVIGMQRKNISKDKKLQTPIEEVKLFNEDILNEEKKIHFALLATESFYSEQGHYVNWLSQRLNFLQFRISRRTKMSISGFFKVKPDFPDSSTNYWKMWRRDIKSYIRLSFSKIGKSI